MDSKIRMKISAILIALFFSALFLSALDVAAAEDIEKFAEFTSESINPIYSGFEKEFSSDGQQYTLDDIKYEKISEEKKTKKEDKTTQQTRTGLSSKSYSVGTTEKITVDGKSYQGVVTEVEYENRTKTGRTGEVNGSQDYGLRVDKPNPPSTLSLPYYDSETGQSYNIEAPMTSLEKTSEKWQDYTYINIVVSNYTDTQFMFNNKIITHNGSTVMGSSYYGELLNMAGLVGDNYKISSVYWVGDAYTEGNMKYRNARADIQAYSCSYKAYYYKKFNLADVPLFDARITFRYSQENVLKTIYKYKAIATYKAVVVETTVAETTQVVEIATHDEVKITVKTITTISFILSLSLAFVILIFFLLTRIKSKNNNLSKVLNRKRRK